MYEKTRAEGFGDEVKRRVMIGTYVLSAGFYDAYYNRARKVRTLIKRDFEQVFDPDGVDAILTPATPSAAFGLGEMSDADPVQMYLNDVFTVTVNLAGLPGIAVPAGLDAQGLPLGLQLIGKPWEEGDLLNGPPMRWSASRRGLFWGPMWWPLRSRPSTRWGSGSIPAIRSALVVAKCGAAISERRTSRRTGS
jgi:hypothetical protein